MHLKTLYFERNTLQFYTFSLHADIKFIFWKCCSWICTAKYGRSYKIFCANFFTSYRLPYHFMKVKIILFYDFFSRHNSSENGTWLFNQTTDLCNGTYDGFNISNLFNVEILTAEEQRKRDRETVCIVSRLSAQKVPKPTNLQHSWYISLSFRFIRNKFLEGIYFFGPRNAGHNWDPGLFDFQIWSSSRELE